jgi:hypothetical protein
MREMMQPVPPTGIGTDFFSHEAPASGGAPPSLLSPPGVVALSCGDLGAALALLAVRTGQLERWTADEARDADEQRAEAQALAEVKAIRSEAGAMREQAWFDAATSVAQVIAASDSPSGGASSSTKPSTASGAIAALKVFGDDMYGADQKDDEANAKGAEAGASSAQYAASGAHDALSDAAELITSALSFYGEYVATQSQTAAASLRSS